MKNHDLERSLRRSKLLRGMSNEAVDAVLKTGATLTFDAGNIIIQEKKQTPGLAIIIKGKAEVYLREIADSDLRARSARLRLASLCSGDCIGEYSLIDNNPASASVLAIEPCLVFVILKSNFERLVAKRDDIAKVIYRNMLELVVRRARFSVEVLDRQRLLTV